MSHFVYDGTTVTQKANADVPPPGYDATKWVTADDLNAWFQHWYDLRDAARLARKRVVRFATTANDSLSGLAARDGVTPVAGDRALVKSQTTASQNGVWVCASGAWARAADAASGSEVVSGMTVDVVEGSACARTTWMLTTTGAIVVGTTALTFEQLGGGSTRAFGEVSQQGNASGTTIADTAVYYLVNLSGTALSGLESQFDSPSSGRLRYTGAVTKTFRVSAEFATTGGSTLPAIIMFCVAKGGSTIDKSQQPVRVSTSVGEHGSCQCLVSLATNDYVELYVRNSTAVSNVTVSYINLQVTEA